MVPPPTPTRWHDKISTPTECVAMVGVFIDTFVVLTLNALVVISTLYTKGGILANGYTGSALEVVRQD